RSRPGQVHADRAEAQTLAEGNAHTYLRRPTARSWRRTNWLSSRNTVTFAARAARRPHTIRRCGYSAAMCSLRRLLTLKEKKPPQRSRTVQPSHAGANSFFQSDIDCLQ